MTKVCLPSWRYASRKCALPTACKNQNQGLGRLWDQPCPLALNCRKGHHGLLFRKSAAKSKIGRGKKSWGKKELWFWKLWLADILLLFPYNLSNCRHNFNYRWAGRSRPRAGLQLEFLPEELLGSGYPVSLGSLAALLAPPSEPAMPPWRIFLMLNEQQDSMNWNNPSSTKKNVKIKDHRFRDWMTGFILLEDCLK